MKKSIKRLQRLEAIISEISKLAPFKVYYFEGEPFTNGGRKYSLIWPADSLEFTLYIYDKRACNSRVLIGAYKNIRDIVEYDRAHKGGVCNG
jgi:hypothetical protein